MALDQLNAAVANLQNAATAIVAKLQADDAALAQAQADLANGDATQAAAVQAVADQLSAATSPATDPTA